MREKMIICAPVRTLESKLYPDATQRMASCGHTVWVAPASQKLLKTGAIPICTRCLPEEPGFQPGKIRYEVTDETVKEVSALLGRPATKAELLALVKKKFGGSQEVLKP